MDRLHALANVPFRSAGLEQVLRQNRKVVQQPEPRRERDGERNGECVRIERGDLQLFPPGLKRIGEAAAGLRVVHGLEREHHVVGRERVTIREGDAWPQLHRIAETIGGARPAFREPRLHFLRQAVDTYELGLGEARDEVGAGVALHEPVEGARLGSHRGHDAPPARHGPGLRDAGVAWRRGLPAADDRRQKRDDDRQVLSVSGQKLAQRAGKLACQNCAPAQRDDCYFACKRNSVAGNVACGWPDS